MEELKAVQNEALMDETIKHELERIKDLEPGSNEYKAAYECAAKFYEIRVKEKTSLADKNAREDEFQMKNQELKLEAEKAEKTWKTEVTKVIVGGVQVFDDRYKDGKMIYKDYWKKSV